MEVSTKELQILVALNEAETKAWESLARYKFQMFGYWASIWVHLNRITGAGRPNPWRGIVKLAAIYVKGGIKP